MKRKISLRNKVLNYLKRNQDRVFSTDEIRRKFKINKISDVVRGEFLSYLFIGNFYFYSYSNKIISDIYKNLRKFEIEALPLYIKQNLSAGYLLHYILNKHDRIFTSLEMKSEMRNYNFSRAAVGTALSNFCGSIIVEGRFFYGNREVLRAFKQKLQSRGIEYKERIAPSIIKISYRKRIL